MKAMNRGWFFLKCALLGLIAIAVVGFVTMVLWNWLVPALFNGPVIDYWQAIGLLALSKLLFWGFGGKRHHYGPGGSGMHQWKNRFAEKFSNMSPQDREAFKEKLKAKWCSWEKQSEHQKPDAPKDSL
jgi:hypothetical protein